MCVSQCTDGKVFGWPPEARGVSELALPCGDDAGARRETIQRVEETLKENVRTRLEQIQRYYSELAAAVARLRPR